MIKVFVYYNLHKHCWSVKALQGPNKGKVIAHKDHVTLTNIIFKVSQAGRKRVIEEQRKNVHAGVVGYWDEQYTIAPMYIETVEEVTYNPYKYSTFVKKLDESIISHANIAYLSNRRVYVQ